MFDDFPYTNFHQLNLDWIIKIAKDFLDQYTHIQEIITSGEESITELTTQGEDAIQAAGADALTDLQNKYDALEALLNAWYNSHSSDIANQLTGAIADFRNAAGAIATDVIDSIPEDYTDLSNAVTQLEQLFAGGLYKYGYFDVDRGGIAANTGVNLSTQADNRARSVGYIPDNITALRTVGGYEFLVYAYQTDGTYLGALDASGNWTTTTGNVHYTNSYTFDHNGKRFRLVFRKTDDSDFGVYYVYPNAGFYSTTDTSLSKPGVPADAKASGNRITELFVDRPEYLPIMKLNDFGTFSQGAIDSSGSILSTTSYVDSSLYSPKYAVTEGQRVALVCKRRREVDTQYISICFYQSDDTFISRVIGASNAESIVGLAPENSAYYRVSLNKILYNSCKEFQLETLIANPITYNPTNENIRMFIFGDSISAGYYSLTDEEAQETGATIVYRPDGLSGVGAAWDRTLAHNYWGYANQKLGFRITNLAYPAQGYLHTDAQDNNAMILVDETNLASADIIVFALGFNDWHYKLTRGNHTPPEAYPYATSRASIDTINKAIWYTLGKAAQKAPNATIIVQTPMNGWLYGGTFDSNWGMGANLAHSGTLAGIVEDVKYWADYYGLQILDLSTGNSTINRLNIQQTEVDGSHPTDKAHKQLGHKVAQALLYK